MCLLAASRIQSSPSTLTYYQTNRFYYTTRSLSQAAPSDRAVFQAAIGNCTAAVIVLPSTVIVSCKGDLRLASLITPSLRFLKCWVTSKICRFIVISIAELPEGMSHIQVFSSPCAVLQGWVTPQTPSHPEKCREVRFSPPCDGVWRAKP